MTTNQITACIVFTVAFFSVLAWRVKVKIDERRQVRRRVLERM